MKPEWRPGNRVELLENGEKFFPRVFEAIGAAEREVRIETFILFDDKVGRELRRVLIEAARRGVAVEMTVDGYGSPGLDGEFIDGLTEAGVRFRVFGPGPTILGMRTNVFRRLHRKLVVIDSRLAFVGGINYGADHLDDFGPQAKQDYAVELEGPVVADIEDFLRHGEPRRRPWFRRRQHGRGAAAAAAHAGNADVMFVTRDNRRHRTDIERQYRLGIRTARYELIIANAYFFPGYRLLRDIRNAARRGVKVTLIVQGAPDVALATAAARWLYYYLCKGGVRIYEYSRRPLHGKVALADGEWATVGSSNLDPLSLYLNLEANVIIRDARFAADLKQCLGHMTTHYCDAIDGDALPRRTWWQMLWGTFVFHLLRRFPAWAGMLPAHTPHVSLVGPEHRDVTGSEETAAAVGISHPVDDTASAVPGDDRQHAVVAPPPAARTGAQAEQADGR
jgi:cardiolipin synthase A/B